MYKNTVEIVKKQPKVENSQHNESTGGRLVHGMLQRHNLKGSADRHLPK